jgi:GT2 family glycosyltransferase
MEISVVVVAYNEAPYIKKCMLSILNQTFRDFELLIIDNSSYDKTLCIIKEMRDERIRYIKNNNAEGMAKSRNAGIAQAKGKYIFFTDADCAPVKYWLEEGLRILKEKKCVGVEGKTLYATARTTISDRVFEDLEGRHGTCNIAYKKEILDKVKGFDPEFKLAFEDIELAYRILNYGEIIFSEDMIVVHQRKKYTIRKLFSDAKKIKNVVNFIKKYPNYRNNEIIRWRIIYPKKFLILLFPFSLILYHSLRSWRDVKLIPFVYFSAFYLRLIVWREAIKEKIFLI